MRSSCLALMTAAITCLAQPLLSEELFTIKVSILAGHGIGQSCGSGAVSVEENRYGRITLASYHDGRSFSIQTSADGRAAVTHLLGKAVQATERDDLLMTADFYLKPTLAGGGDVRLTGYLNTMTLDDRSQEPRYIYDEQELDFALPPDGEAALTLIAPPPCEDTKFTVTVAGPQGIPHKPDTSRRVRFQTAYLLHNSDAQRVEIRNNNCTLGYSLSTDKASGSTPCTQTACFPLEGDDSLLFSSAYEISGLTLRDKYTLAFNLTVSHIYATNPVGGCVLRNKVESEKTTLVVLDKPIFSRIGETVEVQIPTRVDSPLPFSGYEKLTLVGSLVNNRE